jgi:hypothetical protein
MLHAYHRASLILGILSFVLAMNACNKEEPVQSDESGSSTTRRGESLTGIKDPAPPVKDLFLAEKSQAATLAEQRRQSIKELSTLELVTSIRSLNLLGDGNDRMILPSIFAALAEKDPNEMLIILRELPGEYYKTAVLEAFPYLARQNPEFLQTYVLETDFIGEKDRWWMIAACQALGKENPIEALSFFEQMPDEKRQGHLGTTLLKQAASEAPELVVDFLIENQTAPYFTSLFRDVLYTVLVTDPAFALDLASSYPEVDNTDIRAGIYTSMARQSPKWAIEEMSNASPDVRMEIFTRRNRDNQTYFSMLFSEDPTKTIELLEGIVLNTANSNLFSEAGKRLSGLPAGAVRDSSVRSFAELIRPIDPKAADLWLESIR